MTITDTPIDPAAVEEFAFKVMGDASAALVTALSGLGDRLGLWRAIAERGATTTGEIAEATGTRERYVREWAHAMASAGYLVHEQGTFALPPVHAPVLADDGGVAFMGGVQQFVHGMLGHLDQVEDAFRNGGGVGIADYGDHFWTGLERVTGTNFDHLLVQSWIPSIPDLEAALHDGIHVADVGCGTGKSDIVLAKAFPRSRFTGYDVHPGAVAKARAAAEAAGVADRVTFEVLDAVRGLPGKYDAITVFDVLHDSSNPPQLAQSLKRALNPGGVALILEIRSHEHLDENAGPAGAWLYSVSTLYCMTASLATGGAGLGTCGLPEPKLRELLQQGGFATVERIAEGPFDFLYVARG